MSVSDPIGDLLTRIRNAQMRGMGTLELPYSKIKEVLLRKIEEEGYISDVKVFKQKGQSFKMLSLGLLYERDKPKIVGIRRISKPGRRVYVKSSEIRPVIGGTGISIISTPKGLLTGREASSRSLGGEVLCEIW